MNNSPNPGLIPLNDCVLVELDKPEVAAREGKYDTRTNGIVVGIQPFDEDGGISEQNMAHGLTKDLLGKRVYFEEYKEGGRIKRDGKLYCFIKIADIRGYENDI